MVLVLRDVIIWNVNVKSSQIGELFLEIPLHLRYFVCSGMKTWLGTRQSSNLWRSSAAVPMSAENGLLLIGGISSEQ